MVGGPNKRTIHYMETYSGDSSTANATAYCQAVEGLSGDGRLHPLQDAFADLGAAQCGYCTPGILVTAKALLDANPHPGRDQIREALSGNLCRCTGYLQIFEAVEAAMVKIAENGKVSVE